MSTFSKYILKLLNDYKRLLRRYVSTTEREKIIINLGIKRKSLKFDNDVILYNKAYRVIQDIEYWTEKTQRTAAEHSGVDEFYQHLKNYLSQYRVENNLIVHVTQKISCALVQAIQLASSKHLTEEDLSKLENCIQSVKKYGSADQQSVLLKALKQHSPATANLFAPMFEPLLQSQAESALGSE